MYPQLFMPHVGMICSMRTDVTRQEMRSSNLQSDSCPHISGGVPLGLKSSGQNAPSNYWHDGKRYSTLVSNLVLFYRRFLSH